ncbi:MAG: phosphodiester glycosidase family protein [Lachnospiraceae bacterium]|nr:phosphodiester glycosidase family protein [Lachnospiraceae bacterium]
MASRRRIDPRKTHAELKEEILIQELYPAGNGTEEEEEYYEDEAGPSEEDYEEDGYEEEAPYEEEAAAYEEGDDAYYDDEEEYYDEDGEYYDEEEEYYDDGTYEEGEDGEYYDEGNEGYYEEDDAAYGDAPYEEEAAYEEEEPEYEGGVYLENGDYIPDGEYLEDDDPYYAKSTVRSEKRRDTRSAHSSAGSRKKSKKAGKRKGGVGHAIASFVGHFLIFLLITVLLLVFFLYGAVKIILRGPSQAISTQYVSTFHETSALKWLPELFMSKEEMEAILAKNAMPEVEEGRASDTELIVINEEPTPDAEPIELEEIFGTTYHGYMMTIQDPSRVFLGIVDQFAQSSGWIVPQFAEKYNAIGGVNGGEFFDAGSYSYTAWPVGGVISQGEGVFENNASGGWNLVCMTNENKLVLLKGYSVKAALEMGVRDGVHVRHETGPFLIIDGEPLEVPDTEVYGGGKNPRTAIGQRADGAILMCVVDGRQASSLGATFKDMIDIMKEYGAVNAACLDGGTSTQMYYEGEIVNNPYSPTGPRRCPTAWMVKGE